ncbi:MAG TPA: ORF6N domain-containing protein [Candidatus Acidoferrum sp.]|nr:ORF6N domain-containing protein [Candidatus Acidoferrum sp.]
MPRKAARKKNLPLAPERINSSIMMIRGQKVILDSVLATLYEVELKAMNQSVKRNLERFPADFMFQLTGDETDALRSQIVTLKSSRGRHRKYLPYVFTEHGVAMLSSILRSKRAI